LQEKRSNSPIYKARKGGHRLRPPIDYRSGGIHAAAERAIWHVFVGGQQMVRDGEALAFDYADASARLDLAQRRAD
jgi:5-methylthioadenosine/S-adenosylhomocysteine deaminase